MNLDELTRQAVELPEADRVRLAETLLASLGDAEDGAAEAWDVEIQRRTHEIEQGLVNPMPWSEVKASARRKAGA